MSIDTIRRYYESFNADDTDAMVECVSDEFVHDVNEGDRRKGKAFFREFNAHMTDCYKENLTDMVFLCNEDGTRGAAEFVVNGTYLKTDGDLPEANGQTYKLPGGAFITLKDGLITRVTTYYNLSEWIRQVS